MGRTKAGGCIHRCPQDHIVRACGIGLCWADFLASLKRVGFSPRKWLVSARRTRFPVGGQGFLVNPALLWGDEAAWRELGAGA